MTTLPPDGQGDQPGAQPENAPAAPPVPPAPPAPPAAPTAAPQYQAPPAAPQQPQQGYAQQPPAGGGYQQPPAGYAQPVADPVSNITLNYWLSVFFYWIPALIFFLIEKDKGNEASRVFHRDNLNFALLRTGVLIATSILAWIPYLGWLLAALLWVGSVVLFVFHLIAAVKAPENYRTGQAPGFIFNVPFIK